MQKVDNEWYWHCGRKARMTTVHVIIDCTVWDYERKKLWKAIEDSSCTATKRSTLATIMVEGRATEAILRFIQDTQIGRTREEDEKEAAKDAADNLLGWQEAG